MEVAYDADLLNSALAAIGLVCTTIHLRLPHPTTTAVVNNCMYKYVYAFIARNQFPVGCTCLLIILRWKELSIQSSI